MNLAKISANGQITVPVEIRRQLGLKSGDKIQVLQNQNGEIVVSNASAAAIRKAQTAFAGAAEEKCETVSFPTSKPSISYLTFRFYPFCAFVKLKILIFFFFIDKPER